MYALILNLKTNKGKLVMAKVKKTANKRSSAIKASSGKGWKKKFNLQSRKVQFFVVIAIVALLGGGWFTYKSFADSNAAQIAASSLTKNTTTETKPGTGKSGVKVARISPKKAIQWNTSKMVFRKGTYKICATVRYENPSSRLEPASIQFTAYKNHISTYNLVFSERKVSSPSKYNNICSTPTFYLEKDSNKLHFVTIHNSGPTTIRVGAITIVKI